mmetsp:Transcript_16975/g.41369  ORF Transcript_16975/g.41369 Transcript_16975/m.41369 type:complete len:516 (+) Transcript_16975:73-1620(+)
MGGGEGAKERRRLQRLAAAKNGGGASSGEKKNLPFKRNDAGMKPVGKHQFQKKKAFGNGPKVVGRFNKNSNSNNYSNKNSPKHGATTKFHQTKPKKKSKSKKPKHLKRKLEQLGEDNSEEREAVLKKLKDFEREKEKFCGQKKNTNDVHSSNEEMKVAPSKENKDETEESKDFPRGGKNDVHSSNEETKVAPSKENKDETEESKDFPRGGSNENTVSEKKEASEPDSSEKTPNSTETTTSKEPDNDANDDSDSDDEPAEPRRQRGRRRRGRKDTAKQIAAAPVVEDTKSTPSKSGDDAASAGDEDKGETNTAESKKQKDPNRYCTGRKPLTDFVIGKRYTGKVVYVKPFGVFIDIGCHSDAFCHVSRLSDDYVESPEGMFKEGDELEPRVVEIDRKQKKITVSLQSEARIADEHASVVARRERKESRKKSKPKARPFTPKKDFDRDNSSFRKAPTSIEKPATPIPPVAEAPKPKPTPILPPDESTMTPAELKRARKLARRAARREQAEGAVDEES